MDVVETSDSIKIQFGSNDIPYESIYNREYFLLLGIKIVESDEEKKVGGLHQFYKEKGKAKETTLSDSLFYSSDYTVNKASKFLKKYTEKIIETVEKGETVEKEETVEKGEANLESPFLLDVKKNEVVIKKDKVYAFKTLDKEIQEVYDRAKTIFNFDSGYTYNEYSSIIKDLYIQIAYMKFLRVKIEQMDFKRVFKINGRYVLLENNIRKMEETEDQTNCFLDLERKMVELTGKQYEKGQTERDLKMIQGTEMWKYRDLYL